MTHVFVYDGGTIRRTDRVEPEWLDPASSVTVWVDLADPTPGELAILNDVFHFHQLAIDDAASDLQFPKVEQYPGVLYIVMHRLASRSAGRGLDSHAVQTRDVDFFLTRNALVTIHHGQSTQLARIRDLCDRHDRAMAEGPVALLHRIIDLMVEHYRPAMEEMEDSLERLEEDAFAGKEHMARKVMRVKRELASLRRVLIPQRDVVARLSRREFPAVSDEMTYRFRDVYDHLVRLTEEAILFQERVTGIFEVNLSTVSNRLNQVMKLLTVMSTIFLPLTVLTGMWGMNIPLPHFPGGDAAQFAWVGGIMAALVAVMLAGFRRMRWI